MLLNPKSESFTSRISGDKTLTVGFTGVGVNTVSWWGDGVSDREICGVDELVIVAVGTFLAVAVGVTTTVGKGEHAAKITNNQTPQNDFID